MSAMVLSPPDAMTGIDKRLRQLDRGLDIDARQHAVAADVGVDDGLDAVVLELLAQVDHVVARQLAPAVGGDLAVLGIEPDDDVAAEGGAGILQEARVLDRRRADDHVAQAGVEVALDRVQVADAAAELHVDLAADLLEDAADRDLVLGMAGECAIEVDQMQAPRALGDPTARHLRRVFAKGGGLVHVALLEANTMTVFQINRRNEQHGAQAREGNQGFQRRKLR